MLLVLGRLVTGPKMARIAVPDMGLLKNMKRLFSKFEPKTENLPDQSHERAYGVWLATPTSPQAPILAETEFPQVSFFLGSIWESAGFPWACPLGHKNHKYFFLTIVKGANWPVCSVQDPYEVTASVLQ